MHMSRVALVGLGAIAAEVCKNLVLAGVGSVTIFDEGLVSASEVSANVLLRAESVGLPRAEQAASHARAFNPLVTVHAVHAAPLAVPVAEFTCVLHTVTSAAVACELNARARASGVPFFATLAAGLTAWVFVDAGPEFTFASTRKRRKGADGETVPEPGVQVYVPLDKALSTPDSAPALAGATPELSALLALLRAQRAAPVDAAGASELAWPNAEDAAGAALPVAGSSDVTPAAIAAVLGRTIAPVASVVGGLLAQDVLRAITERDSPVCNMLVFSSKTNAALVFQLLG